MIGSVNNTHLTFQGQCPSGGGCSRCRCTLIIHIFTRMTIACVKSIGQQVDHVHKYRRALKHNENRYLKTFSDASVINLHLILSITLLRTNQNS